MAEEKLTPDQASIEAILSWSMHYDMRDVVDTLYPIFEALKVVPAKDPHWDDRVVIYMCRSYGNNASFTDKNGVIDLLNSFNELDASCRTKVHNTNQSEWLYWKREIVLQGALHLVFSRFFPQEYASEHPVSKADLQLDQFAAPPGFNAQSYLNEMKEYFKEYKKYYDEEDPEASKLYQTHLNSFTSDIFEKSRGKFAMKKSKIVSVFNNNDWDNRREHFLEFVNRIARSIFPTPVLNVSFEGKKASEPSATKEGNNLLATSYAKIPETSFSSPQKTNGSSDTRPPNGGKAQMAQLKALKRKYDGKDPLPEALAHSESTKLFASKAATAEKQPMSPVPLISSTSKKQRTRTGNVSASASGDQLPTPLVTGSMSKATRQLTVSEPAVQKATAGSAVIEDIDDHDSDSDSEDNIRHAMLDLNKASESVQKKARRPRKSLTSQLGTSVSGISTPEANGSFDARQIRTKWTADEQLAFEEGIRRLGTGNWKAILDDPHCGPHLTRRTNINLKDRFRTMKNNGWTNDSEPFLYNLQA